MSHDSDEFHYNSKFFIYFVVVVNDDILEGSGKSIIANGEQIKIASIKYFLATH